MAQKHIRTVVFDIGNVLASFDWKGYLKQFHFSPEMEETLGKCVFLDPLWNERDRCSVTEEENTQLYYEKYPHLRRELELVFSRSLEIVQEYDYSADWIRSIKQRGCQVLLLSNYAKESFTYAFEHFECLKLTDGGVISWQVQMCKPEPEFYQVLIERYGLNPEECVFLDDSAKNIETARSLGFHTIHVTNHETASKVLSDLLDT